MQTLEQEAKESATNHIITMLQRPGQLEKIDQFKSRISRKKASVEALLKSAMQSQLDGVRIGLNQLQACKQDLKKVELSLKSMDNLFVDVPKHYHQLNDVREEHMRYSQYVTAIENLKHIFTVPESIAKTKKMINDGKLLHTHQYLTNLENSRDDLLYELHKFPNQSPHDKMMLKAYFAEVETLSNLLEKQLKLVLSRTLNTVRKEPTEIVTALRIIEREEKADEFALQQQKQTGFLAPGRPKKWRTMAFDIFEKAVQTRVEGTHVDEKENNKMWLVRYLELTRQLILEDLRVIKTLCGPCFPPSYDIVNKFVMMYHTALSRHLQELIQNGLEGNEYVSILAWVLNTYSGQELMTHPDLNIDIKKIGPLLSITVLQKLQDQYLKTMEKNYEEWMQNTLSSEKQDWQSKEEPDVIGADGCYRTSAPVIIFQMIDQNLQVTKTISQELTIQALLVSIDQVIKYGHIYREGIIEFKNKHFEDRSQVPHFTKYMISIVNNCLQLKEHGDSLKEQYDLPGSNEKLGEKFKSLLNTYVELRNEAGKYLLEEVFLDLEKHFEEIFSPRWMSSTLAVETICVTLDDYFQDYRYLCESNFEYIIKVAQNLVAKRYITSMLQKKVSFKTNEESQAAADKLRKEITQIRKCFLCIASNSSDSHCPLDIIITLSVVLKCEDSEMLSLDLHNIVKTFPDITEDHLLRLLYLRGDMPRAEIREKITFAMNSGKPTSNVHQTSSLFSEIAFVERFRNLIP